MRSVSFARTAFETFVKTVVLCKTSSKSFSLQSADQSALVKADAKSSIPTYISSVKEVQAGHKAGGIMHYQQHEGLSSRNLYMHTHAIPPVQNLVLVACNFESHAPFLVPHDSYIRESFLT